MQSGPSEKKIRCHILDSHQVTPTQNTSQNSCISIYMEPSKQKHHTLWLIIPLRNWSVTRFSSAKQRQSPRLPDHSAGSANAAPPAVASCGNLGAVQAPGYGAVAAEIQRSHDWQRKECHATKGAAKITIETITQMCELVILHVGPEIIGVNVRYNFKCMKGSENCNYIILHLHYGQAYRCVQCMISNENPRL